MTSKVEAEKFQSNRVQTQSKMVERNSEEGGQTSFLTLLRNTFCMHIVSHRSITGNFWTPPGRMNFKIVKQISVEIKKKKREAK